MNKINEEYVHNIIKDLVLNEETATPPPYLGINKKLINQYIKYKSDSLLLELGYNKLYNVKNPFSFMQKLNSENKNNLFEDRPSEYQDINNKNNLFEDRPSEYQDIEPKKKLTSYITKNKDQSKKINDIEKLD